MPKRSTPVEWLVFLALGIAWGSSYLFIKIGVETLTPFTLVAGRLAIGAGVLAVAMAVTRQALPPNRSVYLHLLVVAMLGIVIPFFLITWGEQSIDSGLASILNGTVPLFAIVMAAMVLREQPSGRDRPHRCVHLVRRDRRLCQAQRARRGTTAERLPGGGFRLPDHARRRVPA